MGRPRRMPLRLSLVALGLLSIASAVAAQDADADTLPASGTRLEPGRYVTSVVGPTIDFRVEDGWVVGVVPPGPIFTLERTDQPVSVLTVTRFDGDVYLDSCDSTSLTSVEPTVQRLAEVIGGNPYLVPGTPRVITVDGYAGIQLDAGVPAYDECALPWVLIWATPLGKDGEFIQVADQQSRFIILDVDGDTIVIAIETYPGVPFGSMLDASMGIVGSMRITPGRSDPPEPTASTTPPSSPEPEPTTDASVSPGTDAASSPEPVESPSPSVAST